MFRKSIRQPSSLRPDLSFLEYVRSRNRTFRSELLDREKEADSLMGCMVGLAIGDVLGCPVEGLNYQDIQRRYGKVEELITPTYWRHWRLPGLHSDDTQQALAVILALQKSRSSSNDTHNNKILAKNLATIYVEGFRISQARGFFGCWRGTGKGFRSVVEQLSMNQGAPTWPFGFGVHSAGVGAVMRIPPVGILVDRQEQLGETVRHVTTITHTDPLATISAFVIAAATHILSRTAPGQFHRQSFLGELFNGTRRLEADLANTLDASDGRIMSTLLQHLPNIISLPPNQAMREIVRVIHQLTGKRLHPTGGYAPTGVAASLYFFLYNLDRPVDGLLMSINAGGDTDTIGAVVGSLFGTLFGVKAYTNFIDDLVALDLIVDIVNGKNTLHTTAHDFIHKEHILTSLESDFKYIMSTL